MGDCTILGMVQFVSLWSPGARPGAGGWGFYHFGHGKTWGLQFLPLWGLRDFRIVQSSWYWYCNVYHYGAWGLRIVPLSTLGMVGTILQFEGLKFGHTYMQYVKLIVLVICYLKFRNLESWKLY